MAVVEHATRRAQAEDEQDLVAAIRCGDDRAFELLYERYRARIGAYIQGMVVDHGRAEDIAQDVFIAALRRLRASDQPVLFRPWLYEIAKNACIDEFRRRGRAREVSLDGGRDQDEVGRLRSLSPTPDAAIESKQRLDALRGAFFGLSESHHRILVLRELEGLSYHQIGDRLGLSKPVVESTLFRARRRLGEEFEELESGRRCARVQELIAGTELRPPAALGLRDRRLMMRHLAHCDACRRAAHQAGFEDPERLAGRVAAAAAAPVGWLRTRTSPRPAAPAVRAGIALSPSLGAVATRLQTAAAPESSLTLPEQLSA
jgi:RNA polymerase sigma factor (sigma-70 family)